MFVKDKMSVDLVTVSPETNVLEALELMRENKIRRLPVVENGKLKGMVTQLDLLRISPSPATSLSVFELNYLLSKMMVKEAMTSDPIVVAADATVEEAALIMRDHQVGGLPVVQDDKLVGIITETNIFDAFIESMGLRRAGIRLSIEVPDHPGVLAKITQIIYQFKANIISLATFAGVREGEAQIIVRIAELDSVEELISELEKQGYQVFHVAKLA